MKLNYGCGMDYREGWVNVDQSMAVKSDYRTLYDLSWDYKNKFTEVLMSHVFEHIQDPIQFMEDLYSFCAPDAKVTIISPYYTSIYAWSDPDHKRGISERSFDHFNRLTYFPKGDGSRNPVTPASRFDYFPECDFEPTSMIFVMEPEFENVENAVKANLVKYCMNAVREIRVTLTVIKPARAP